MVFNPIDHHEIPLNPMNIYENPMSGIDMGSANSPSQLGPRFQRLKQVPHSSDEVVQRVTDLHKGAQDAKVAGPSGCLEISMPWWW